MTVCTYDVPFVKDYGKRLSRSIYFNSVEIALTLFPRKFPRVRLAVNRLYQKIYVLEINRDFSYLLPLNVYSMDDCVIATYIYLYIYRIH